MPLARGGASTGAPRGSRRRRSQASSYAAAPLIDTFYVGRLRSPGALGAVATASEVFTLAFAFSLALRDDVLVDRARARRGRRPRAALARATPRSRRASARARASSAAPRPRASRRSSVVRRHRCGAAACGTRWHAAAAVCGAPRKMSCARSREYPESISLRTRILENTRILPSSSGARDRGRCLPRARRHALAVHAAALAALVAPRSTRCLWLHQRARRRGAAVATATRRPRRPRSSQRSRVPARGSVAAGARRPAAAAVVRAAAAAVARAPAGCARPARRAHGAVLVRSFSVLGYWAFVAARVARTRRRRDDGGGRTGVVLNMWLLFVLTSRLRARRQVMPPVYRQSPRRRAARAARAAGRRRRPRPRPRRPRQRRADRWATARRRRLRRCSRGS